MSGEAVRAPSVGVERFSDDFLEGLRREGDVPADEAVAAFFDALDAPASTLYPLLLRSGAEGLDDDTAPGVAPFARAVEPWPDWVDPALVRRGQELFGDCGVQLATGLFLASLPMSYACAKGAEPLVRTSRMTNNPKRRILETGQMVIAAMSPGALDPGARGERVVRHVRLMHAAVRHVLTHPEAVEALGAAPLAPWDDSLGVPLNQEDLLGTLLAFSVIGVESLARVGVNWPRRDVEAYVHAWNVVGHQIGVRRDLLPLDFADGKVVADRIFAHQSAPSEAGRELTTTTIAAMEDLIRLPVLRGLPASGVRYFLGDRVADLLGVAPSNWTRFVFSFMRRCDGPWNAALRWLPGDHSLAAALGRRVVVSLEDVERGPGRPRFEISDELRQAWGVGTP